MKTLTIVLALLATAGGSLAQTPRPDNAQSLAHIESARQLAGDDAWLNGPFNFYCVAGKARPNDTKAPAMAPVRLFDNLYALGNSEATVHAITTSQGIVLIDSGYADRVETDVVAGLRTVGLNPDDVKYVLVGHGHGDHFGGSSYFQEHGARVGLSAADWDVMYPATPPANANAANQVKPRRDLVLAEGQPLTVGDTTITFVAIPGHTPGSLGFIFPVKDGRQSHVAGLFGGTILTVDRISTPGVQQYVQSIGHYLDAAKKMHVDVEVQNHALFDMTPERLVMLRTRKTGQPNPFVVTTDKYVKFWTIVAECMQAEIARR